jgi:hypothetical protein
VVEPVQSVLVVQDVLQALVAVSHVYGTQEVIGPGIQSPSGAQVPPGINAPAKHDGEPHEAPTTGMQLPGCVSDLQVRQGPKHSVLQQTPSEQWAEAQSSGDPQGSPLSRRTRPSGSRVPLAAG